MKFLPKSRQDWRDWLRKHHKKKSEVWLVFIKKSTKTPNLSYNDAVEEALCFGWVDGVKKSIDEKHYTHRFSPRKPNSKWSETNKKRVARLTKSGLIRAAG
ncbi:MAG: hypothetical protein AAF438_12465, partial [Pseudomonadota bacterium]